MKIFKIQNKPTKEARMGSKIVAVAVLEVISVRKVSMVQMIKTRADSGMLFKLLN